MNGCLINCFTTESKGYDKHILDKALQLLRYVAKQFVLKAKKTDQPFFIIILRIKDHKIAQQKKDVLPMEKKPTR